MSPLIWRIGTGLGLSLAVMGWLGYLPFLSGAPGCYWLAQAYGWLLPATVAVLVTALLTTPVFGIAFGILAIASLHPGGRRRARQGAKKLLVVLLIEVLAIAALVPNVIWLGEVTTHLAIAPWHMVYRAIYIAPLDDNYGDLMLVKCRWFGLCHQVYRRYTDVGSATAAELAYNADTDQVALHLEGRWVYVRSPGTPPCREDLDFHAYGTCDFGGG